MKIKLMNESFHGIGFRNLQRSSLSQHFPFEDFFSAITTQFPASPHQIDWNQSHPTIFRKERDEKSLALPELSSKKLNRTLTVQGSRRERWKTFSSIREVKAGSPAAVPRRTQGTKGETADSTGLSGTETQDVGAEEGSHLIFFLGLTNISTCSHFPTSQASSC